MSETGVTQLLALARTGDDAARDQLFAAVYGELHAMARRQMRSERRAVTLSPSVLVSEAYLRLVGGATPCESRRHFFAAAAEAMRRICVDAARARKRLKRGGGGAALPLDAMAVGTDGGAAGDGLVHGVAGADRSEEQLAVHEVLDRLAEHFPRQAEMVKLRYFAGLSVEQTAEAMGVSPRTVNLEWRFARAWLHRALGGEGAADDDGKP